jgi:hypothetical protein
MYIIANAGTKPQRQINEFLAWIQGVNSIESTPVTRAEFNAEDSIRARGMGIRLDEKI